MFSKLNLSLYSRSPMWAQNLACTVAGYRLRKIRYGPEFDRWARFVSDARSWSAAELREYQREQLRGLIHACFDSVPFYADRWRAAGLSKGDFGDLPDLGKFPHTEKEDLFRAGDRVISSEADPSRLIKVMTGGSTGMPLPRYFTSEEMQRHYAYTWDRLRPGVEWGEKYATFQGKEVVPGNQSRPPYWRVNRVANQVLYSMRHLSPEKLQGYAESLASTPFVYYQGYVSILSVVADFMASHGIEPTLPPRAVFCTSEQLTLSARKLMERAWNTRVWDEYCQAERCSMIMECEAGNRHVQLDYGVIEFEPIGHEGDLVLAEIVCTGFVPRAAPLVRYRVGDRVLIDEGAVCSCGRPGPVIKAIRGRTGDVIFTPDGRKYPHISLIVDELRNVRQTQVVQEKLGAIRVRIVPFPEFSPRDESHLIECFQSLIGGGIQVRVERVRELERLPNGKIKSIINRVPPEETSAPRETDRV